MKPLLAALVGALLLLGAACSSASPPPATEQVARATATQGTTTGTPASAAISGSDRHESARALEHVRVLSVDIGPRVAGTPGEEAAAEYIRAQFESYGYSVEVMTFSFEGDRFRPARIAVNGQDIEAYTMAGSGGREVTGEAMYVGLADRAGLEGKDLAGKVAVADRGTLRFGEKAENVQARGAIGLIVINNEPGSLSGSLGFDSTLTVVGAAQEDGGRLIEAARAGARITLRPADSDTGHGRNVIARPGPGARCEVLVGGHHDTVPGAPGANDNASGTANVLELARAFAVGGLEKGLCFATFGAEESGLFGSKALAERMERGGELPRYMVNLDVTGIGSPVEVIGTRGLREEVVDMLRDSGMQAIPSSLPENSGSDHQSFAALGVEVVFFTSGDFRNIHTPMDVFDEVREADLGQVGLAAQLTIEELLARA
jgi:aminopeptidase YwaD